ncbi:hypothetical protein R5W24_001554 [Gemmata sp. JC717]|nr:hypothetical protein [Gemmata algarum]MDY3552472.1 hypothetical protein [Gemmata algarum]
MDKQVKKSISANWQSNVKNGVQFIDYDGLHYTGTYSVNKDETITLTLSGHAPIAPGEETVGTKIMVIFLERPKPPPTPFGPREPRIARP